MSDSRYGFLLEDKHQFIVNINSIKIESASDLIACLKQAPIDRWLQFIMPALNQSARFLTKQWFDCIVELVQIHVPDTISLQFLLDAKELREKLPNIRDTKDIENIMAIFSAQVNQKKALLQILHETPITDLAVLAFMMKYIGIFKIATVVNVKKLIPNCDALIQLIHECETHCKQKIPSLFGYLHGETLNSLVKSDNDLLKILNALYSLVRAYSSQKIGWTNDCITSLVSLIPTHVKSMTMFKQIFDVLDKLGWSTYDVTNQLVCDPKVHELIQNIDDFRKLNNCISRARHSHPGSESGYNFLEKYEMAGVFWKTKPTFDKAARAVSDQLEMIQQYAKNYGHHNVSCRPAFKIELERLSMWQQEKSDAAQKAASTLTKRP